MTDLCQCPHCGEMMRADLCDEGYRLVTYWGDDFGPVEFECNHCGKTVVLCEVVTRHWELSHD